MTATFHSAFAHAVGTATITARVDNAVAHIPVTVALVAFTSVTNAGDHGCGLNAAHEAWCWGSDYVGQLGTQTFLYEGDPAPERVLGGLSFVSIAAGRGWTCALTSAGVPYCWGGVHAVGEGSMLPQKINGVTLVSLSNSGDRACGLHAAGTAWCWGNAGTENILFTPPVGCAIQCWTPVAVGHGKHWSQLSAGAGSHICGIDTNGAAECWGSNHSGQIGDGTLVDDSLAVVVHNGIAFTRISAGDAATCGTTASGNAYCWGSDTYGELGSGVQAPSCSEGNLCYTSPIPVAGGHTFVTVDVDDDHACGRTSAGEIYCWGYSNGNGAPTIPALRSGDFTFTTSSEDGGECGMATNGEAICVRHDGDPVAILGQQ
ncbi:MAG: hypothetical protein H0U66_11175 [Gemmatimonadaceae bacterium]|nr:hypothetical protein [Gemmatimonadaceae bacterium]